MRNTVRVQRAIKNISQEELADALNVSRNTIGAIERNTYIPSALLACRIAHYFGISFDELFILEPEDLLNN